MSQNPGNTIIRKTKAQPNVYSVLIIVATLALGFAFGYVSWANGKLTGKSNPFIVMQPDEIVPPSK